MKNDNHGIVKIKNVNWHKSLYMSMDKTFKGKHLKQMKL